MSGRLQSLGRRGNTEKSVVQSGFQNARQPSRPECGSKLGRGQRAMLPTERSETSLVKEWICSEIRALGVRQEALLHGAAFVPLTREEAAECEHCASRMADLVKQLSLLCPNTDSMSGERHEQKSEKAAGNGRKGD